MENELEEGTIIGFAGSWGSGLGVLMFSDHAPVHCDNAQTVRALDSCFGGFISPNHAVNPEAIHGKRISFSTDALGLLEGFSPVEETP